ncbi:MAG TPA: phosphoribosylamine--glycine ligase [Burkholderiaceae bacterium]|nr:phosphoribosylamine--glycine ligase [Burkholderiaceae bacterium]
MRALVIGGGGREHALAWKLAQSPRLSRIFVAPGNGGTARDRRLENVRFTDPEQLAAFAAREAIDLTVVGPEAPLAAGVVDVFQTHNLRIFGPTRAAAQLESSKDFAKSFMRRHGIPTAGYQTFTRVADARAYLDRKDAPIVVKADGLAAGKGVVVAQTRAEAKQAVEAMLLDNRLGGAGARVVIEDFLAGEEASFIVMSDGRNVLALATSQDHKRLRDGDAGPNTGGMGAYSPAPVVTPQLHAKVMREIILPAVNGMASDGVPYVGFLYAGLMIGAGAGSGTLPSVHTLEFNCRLGDPETQPIMMRLKTDLAELLDHALQGRLDQIEAEWDRRTALGVVLAAHGYPEAPRSGDEITALAADTSECMTFHAGSSLEGGRLLTTGGRVLCVTALGDGVRTAQKRAYDAIAQTHFDGMQYRHDIGHHALKPRG